MTLAGPDARAAYFGPRADRLALKAGAAGHATVRALEVVDGMVRFALVIKATPKVYTAITGDLERWMAQAWGETRPAVLAAAEDLAVIADDGRAGKDPRWKERAERRVGALQRELAKAGQDLASSPAEAKTLGRYLAAATMLGHREITAPMGWEAGFTLPDQDAIHGLTNAGLFWIGRHYGDAIDGPKLLALTEETMITKGLGRVAGGKALAQAFGAEHDRSAVYWRGMAATVTTRARSLAAVQAMAETGATVYEYVNPVDERTSDVCRRLDGTRFEVRGAVELRERFLQAATPEEAKAIAPWPKVTDLEDGAGNLLPPAAIQAKGIAWPPLHFHCRSSVDVVLWLPISLGDVDPLADVEPKAPRPPRKPRVPKPVASAARHEVILGTKTGSAQGSNAGGFYTGTDGVRRYVKFYANDGQAHAEHLANRIYRDLGLAAPRSELFRTAEGKLAYASEILDHDGTLGALWRTSTAAQRQAMAAQALDGFAADVLTANWDAAGLDLDNMIRLRDGTIARIDNGGSLLYRAQGARKTAASLEPMAEWWMYLDGSNPGYRRLAEAAGVSTPRAIATLEDQIDRIAALRPKRGGWAAYLKDEAELNDADRKAIADLLELRTSQLLAKRSALPALRRLDELETTRKFTASYEARAWGNENLAPARGTMSSPELASTRDYTGSGYRSRNQRLRDGAQPTAQDKALDRAIARSKLPEDLVLYRGVYGCEPLTRAVRDGIRSEGNTITDPAFGSSSMFREVAENFGSRGTSSILFRILARKGTPAMYVEDITTTRGELEVINARNTTIRVLSSVFSTEQNRWLVDVEIIPTN